jgi:hypothetical protein
MALLCPGAAAAQASGAGAFLRQEPNARAAALAGAAASVSDDSGGVLINPAALARLIKPEVSATRVLLFEDTSFDAIAAGVPTRRWGSFAAAYVRQTSGGFEARNGPNDAPTTFSVGQSAVLAGWGWSPPIPWQSDATPARERFLSIGAAIKSVREEVGAASASGGGLDAGLLLRPREGVAVALVVDNLVAPNPALGTNATPYPRSVDFSPSYTRAFGPAWRLMTALRVRDVRGEGTEPAGGLELRYGRAAALRFGFQAKGPSTGFGIAYGNTRLDYALLLHDLGLSHSLSLVLRFGQTREELEATIRRGISRLSRADGARLAKAYLQKADDESRDGRLMESRRDIEAASLLDPENADIAARLKKADAQWEETLRRQTLERLAALARRQQEEGNLLAARQYWRSVLDMDESHAEARRGLSYIDGELSGEERARAESLRRAEDANDVAQALAQASASLSRGMLRQARMEAEKAQKRHPDNGPIAEFLTRTRLQISAFTAARLEEARKAIGARDYPAALEALQSARREAPENQDVVRLESQAESELRRTIPAETRKQAEQLYYRAVDQYLKGNYAAAGALADQVLALDPSSEPSRALKTKVGAAMRYSR